MAAILRPPGPNDDVRVLWRTVAECVDVLNALMNMTGKIEGGSRMLGKLEMQGDSCTLTFRDNKGVNSPS